MYRHTSSSVQSLIGKARTCSPGAHPTVVQVPQLGALVARIPLPELVAEREDALLGAGLVLVATSAAEAGVEPVLGDGVEQRHRLQPVARGASTGIGARGRGRSTAAPTRRPGAHRACSRRGRGSRGPLGSCGRCRRASPRTGTAPGANAFATRWSTTTESLPPREQHDGVAQLGRDLADDEDRVRLERVEVIERSRGSDRWSERPRSESRVQPTFGLGRAGPATGASVFSGLDAHVCTASIRSTGSRRTAAG